mgnify:CR=1 FL=1
MAYGTRYSTTNWWNSFSLPINPYGGVQSTTAHPRWQRRLEAKIAYVSCLRRNCCMNTQWPDSGVVFTPTM